MTAQIVGGQPRERALAREILQKMAPSPVSVVRFTGSEMDVKGHRAWIGASWEEYVFAYAYALVARQRHIPISGVSLDLGYGSLDNALANAPRTPVDNSQLNRFENTLRAAAKAAHASIWFRTLRPGPVALEATVTAKNPAALLKYHFASFRTPPPKGLFGLLLRVAYPNGSIAFARGDSPGGTTASWDPRVAGCSPETVPSSPPASFKVPKCPV